ncbi:lycopene cyclase family protein [Actinoplanes sp. NPDC051494]|uniref:lycopene cyclase family protein n=1 Tax=Actinoplanes sp. NPDC051494 TaxID=3363907 RepID=UPI0037A70211
MDVDLAVIGCGGAGSLVLAALQRRGVRGLRIAVIDPQEHRDRTWAFWTGAEDELDPVLESSWASVDLVGVERRRRLALAPMRYAMVRSAPVFALAVQARERLGARLVTSVVSGLVDDGSGVAVLDGDGKRIVRARWALDSRPAAPARPGRTSWLQHFRGWWVESPTAVFDPSAAVLMDFRTPQPARGVSFGYVLPTSATSALVEYTEFSAATLTDTAYDAALRAYLTVLGISGLSVHEVENGAIPMTDAPFILRPSARVVRLGTAGGATRASTGYTFSAMRRQADQIAGALVRGKAPVPRAPYPRRHRWMDAVALRAWDTGLVEAPEFYERLFAANPSDRVLRFLDGLTTPLEEVALMASTPLAAMTRAAAGDALARVRRGPMTGPG